MYDEKHVCMLSKEPTDFDLPPTAGICARFRNKIRFLKLPCEWHHGSLLFFRSQKSLRLERVRQVETAHWLVWHPYSPIKYYWDCFFMFTTLAGLSYMPVQAFITCPNPYDPFIIASDMLTALNICTNFITGNHLEEGNTVILELKQIARLYLQGYFILDLISALPLQFIEIFDDCNYPTHTAWFIFKLLRFITLGNKWKSFYKQNELSYVSSVSCTVLFRILFFFHWMTYVHFQIPMFCVQYYPLEGKTLEWLHKYNILKNSSTTVLERYTSTLYYVCGVCIGSGYSQEVDDFLLPELLLNATVGIIALIVVTYSFTTLLRLAMYNRYEVFLYNGRLKELQEYMIFKRLPKFLQRKIQMFINYKFYEHYFNETAIMNTINEQIKQDINMYNCKKLVMNVPLFQNMPVALINTIIFSLTQILFMPGETVIKHDQPGQSIYLIYSGTVAVINSSGREVAHLRDGSYFGESALLDPGSLRTATMIALEITEIYKLNNKEFQACLQPYPHIKRRLEGGAGVAASRASRAASTSYRV